MTQTTPIVDQKSSFKVWLAVRVVCTYGQGHYCITDSTNTKTKVIFVKVLRAEK